MVLTFCITDTLTTDQCFKEGTTWSTAGQISFIPQIESIQKCFEICMDEENCNGYTWHGKLNQRLSNVCILFEALLDEHNCSDCVSGKTTNLDNCLCKQNNDQCEIDNNNFIDAKR